jgi:hypothetical protein
MGSPTISGTDKLLPKTLMSQLASGGEYTMNKPVGAKMGAFVNQMHELIAREREVANTQVGAFRQQFMGGLPSDFTKRRQADIDRLINVHANTAGAEKSVKPQDVDKLSDDEVEKMLKARGL